MEYLQNARICSNHVVNYVSDVGPLAKQSVAITWQAATLYLQLLATILRPMLTLLLYLHHTLTPALTVLAQRLFDILCMQPRHIVLAEVSTALSLAVLIAIERHFSFLRRAHMLYIRTHARLTRRFRRLVSAVRLKSQLAASILPHFLFAILAYGFHLTIARFFLPFTRGPGLIMIACVRPAVRTLTLLYAVDCEEKKNAMVKTPVSTHDEIPGSDSPAVISASSALATTPSQSIRRRKASANEFDGLRRRAASVAKDIEEEGRGTEKRVRIDGTPMLFRLPSRSPFSLLSSRGSPDSDLDSVIQSTPADDLVRRASVENSVLKFWVVFGVVWGLRSLTWYFCPTMLEGVISVMDVWMFYVFVWAQFSLTMGADLVYPIFARFLQKRGVLKRTASKVVSSVQGTGGEETVQQIGLIMRLVSSLRVFDAVKSGRVWRFVSESGMFIVLGCMFALVPRVVTFGTTLLAGVFLPCVWSADVLESGETDDLGVQRHNWLAYWGVFSLVDAVYAVGAQTFGWLPLWYHVKMGIILWLQVPNFRGAVVLLDGFMIHVGSALSSVKKQTYTPRKRKRG